MGLTTPRLTWSILSSVCLVLSLVFLIVTEVGNTSISGGRADIYFIRLDLANVVPLSFGPNAALLNSIARTVGLHDFYQVGLWNFCEGYFGEGVTYCSPTQTLYWFDPVTILLNELLAGATIQLPPELSDILGIIRIASHWMFGLFLAGACLSFVLIFLLPLAVYTRWASLPLTLLTLINALFITVAAVVATVMFSIMKNVFETNNDVNIGAELGTAMFAVMWIAAAFSLLAFIIQACLACCCVSKRDVKRHTKKVEKAERKIERKESRKSGKAGGGRPGWFSARRGGAREPADAEKGAGSD